MNQNNKPVPLPRRHLSLAAALLITGLAPVVAGDPPDISKLTAAADKGDAEAQLDLARAYLNGKGVEKDPAKAFELTKEAAALGHPEALGGMGFFYSQGLAVQKSEQQAADWFKKGAEAGSLKAQTNLGIVLRQGKDIKTSNEESLAWLHKAAGGGFLEAKSVLGQLYFTGDKLQPKDFDKAVPFLQEAAEAGDPVCQNMLGVAFRDGRGVEKSRDLALEWFKKAARNNDRKAQLNLAQLLGVESPRCENRQEALKWLIIASERNELGATKIYREILPTLPAELLSAASKDAQSYLSDNPN